MEDAANPQRLSLAGARLPALGGQILAPPRFDDRLSALDRVRECFADQRHKSPPAFGIADPGFRHLPCGIEREVSANQIRMLADRLARLNVGVAERLGGRGALGEEGRTLDDPVGSRGGHGRRCSLE